MRLVFVVYWLLIFEGALRKWVFPQASDVLFFIRDPFVLAIYFLALRRGLFRKVPLVVACGYALAVCFWVLIALQTATLPFPPAVFAYGWRNYFFYLPLLAVIPQTFKTEDIDRLVRYSLLVAIPIGALTLLQYFSPPDALVNKTYTDDAFIFMVTEDRVRTYGTFTFTAGQATFVGSVVALALAVWTNPPQSRPLGRGWLIASTCAVFSNFAVAGSRTVYFFAGGSFCAAIAAALLIRQPGARVRALTLPIILGVVSAIAFTTAYADAFNSMRTRQESAVEAEGSTVDRAIRSFTDVLDIAFDAPALGYGLGFGTNAGAKLATGTMHFTLAEDEWSRIVLECGALFGGAYILLRIAIVISLFWRCARATRRSGSMTPMLLFSFASLLLLASPLTMQGTINGYGWLFAGFTAAACVSGQDKRDRSVPSNG